jgi:hypothetical protein
LSLLVLGAIDSLLLFRIHAVVVDVAPATFSVMLPASAPIALIDFAVLANIQVAIGGLADRAAVVILLAANITYVRKACGSSVRQQMACGQSRT